MVFNKTEKKEISKIAENFFEENLLEGVTEDIADKVAKIIAGKLEKKLDSVIAGLQTKLDNAIGVIEDLKCSNEEMQRRIDNLEQGNRRNNLRILGVPEPDNENVLKTTVGILNNNLKCNISEEKIECYRVGKPASDSSAKNYSRQILVKFAQESDKSAAYGKKRLLKNSKIIIKEDLTVNRLNTCKEALEHFGPKNVWTQGGIIFAKDGSGKKHKFSSIAELKAIKRSIRRSTIRLPEVVDENQTEVD